MKDRAHNRTNIALLAAKQHDFRALAQWVVSALAPLRYKHAPRDGAEEVAVLAVEGLVANDADDPNTTAPSESRVLPMESHHLGVLGLWPTYSQDIVLEVWARTGLAGVGQPAWVRLKTISYTHATPQTHVEEVVETGYRDVWVRVLSGADAGHPVSIYHAVA